MSTASVLIVTAAATTIALITWLPLILDLRGPPIRRVQLALNLLDNYLTEPGRTVLRERLFDPANDLDADDCIKMLHTPRLLTRLTHADDCDCSRCVLAAHRKAPR